MRGFSKDDDSETLDRSDSLVTEYLDKTLFGGKKDNHLGTSYGWAIDKNLSAKICIKLKRWAFKVNLIMKCMSNIFLPN